MKKANCFVCEADLFISNPEILNREYNSSGYFGKMVQGYSSDWVFDVQDGRISRIGKCGTDCFNMVGISYFKREDATMIADAILSFVQDSNWGQRFWDEVVNVLIEKELNLVVFPVGEMDIVECDTIEDLKNLEAKLCK